MSTEVKDVVARLREKVEQGHSLAAFMAERQLEGAETIEALARVAGEAASLLDEVLSVLQSPEALHANMLRGGVAKLPIRQALHLHGAGALEKWDNADAAESRATAAEGRVALLEEEREELRKIIAAFVQRFELYAGPNDMHAGKHDLDLLTLGRARLAKGGQ